MRSTSGCVAALVLLLAACRPAAGVPEGGRSGLPRVSVVTPFRQPVRTEVQPGDTLESVARRLAPEDWVEWRDALAREIDPKALRPGMVREGFEGPGGRRAAAGRELCRRPSVVSSFRLSW